MFHAPPSDAHHPCASLIGGYSATLAGLGPFEPAPHLAVALSGGADSTALTLLTHYWVKGHGGHVTALIVDHGLRPESAAEAAEVQQRMAARGIACVVLTLPTCLHEETGNLMARARQARYDALTNWCRAADVLHLLVAHHAQDQAETAALHHLRGQTEDGAAGMAALSLRSGVRVLRPLLPFSKEQLVAYLLAEPMAWVEDPTNRNLQFRRNALRHSLTEEMRAQLLADARDAGRARATRDVAQAKAAARVILSLTSASVTCNREQFNALPPEHATRLLADMLTALGGGTTRPRQHETRRLYHAMLEPAFTAATLGHCHIETRQHMLHIRREQRKIASGNAAFSPAKPLAASPFWWL
jgi:tRNA(Ile)-lysidine synthase